MIYLYASSSNNITFIPSSSISSGESIRALFVDGFTEDSSSFIFPVTSLGNWVKGTIILPTNLSLEGGTYDVTFQTIVAGTSQVWGTSTQVYGTSEMVWSLGTIGDTFVNQATTKAYVSESVARSQFSSTNENGAYIVFNG
jgi:hypothetical protein